VLARQVLIEVDRDRITAVIPDSGPRPSDAHLLEGLVLPGLVNAHSHAFHRVLRGRSEWARGTFWSWRNSMYALAERLDPESYEKLATAVYAEMALAGITTVGEFHYLHHGPGGVAYTDPNEMGRALLRAAGEVGIRITLLDACYLRAGFDEGPLSPAQLRFSDQSASNWAERVAGLLGQGDLAGTTRLAGLLGASSRIGVAAHSVRACDEVGLATVASLSSTEELPLHVHLAEQAAESRDCLAATSASPTGLLDEAGALGPRTTAVHAIDLQPADQNLLGLAHAGVCACPTTERELADGVGPFRALADAGVWLSLGSDSQAVIDLFEEARALELNERLEQKIRGIHTPAELFSAATRGGAYALGWQAGAIAVGGLADLISVDLDTPRLGGADLRGDNPGEELLARLIFAASAAEVRDVVIGGELVVTAGVHRRLGGPREVASRLQSAMADLFP